MSRIKVHPPRRPKLSKDGVLTFMGPGGRGLAGLARVCSTPSCPCRDILLRLAPIDFRVESVALTRGKLTFTTVGLGGLAPAHDPEAWIAARLNVDTGELLPRLEHAQKPGVEALLAPLRDALDGELLDDLARLWLRLKRQPPASDEPVPDPDLDDWQPGQTLAYGQVYEELRIDTYPAGERLYEVVDLYCPDPDCDCNKVTVDFVDPAGDTGAGAATVDLGTGDVRFRHDTGDETLVPDLWQRFVFRHRGVGLLFERLGRMKDYGETLFEELDRAAEPTPQPPPEAPTQPPPEAQRQPGAAAPARRAGVKIGRNKPCPCGSGKKYKKCCLPRLSP